MFTQIQNSAYRQRIYEKPPAQGGFSFAILISMIIRNSLLLAFFSGISLLLGIVRDRLLSLYVGVGPVLDVYNASFRIPDFIYGILFALVSAGTVVPFLTKAAHDDNKDELQVRFNSLFFFFSGLFFIVSLCTIIILPYVTHLIVPGFSPEQQEQFIWCTRILLVQPFLLGLSALISCLGQVRHRFILYSFAPILYALGIIFSIIFLYKPYGLSGIVIGVLGGAGLGLFVQSYALWKERMTFSFSYSKWSVIQEHLRNALPRSGSTIISRLRDIVFAAVATSLGVGVLSIYIFAQRILDAFVQVVVQSAATATLPVLSHHHATGNLQSYKKIFAINIITILSAASLASLFCILFSKPLVQILYGNTESTEAIASLMSLLAYTLPTLSINVYFVSAFNAAKDGKGLFYANVLATSCCFAVLFFCRAQGYGVMTLAFATWTLSLTYTFLLILFYTRKRRTI